MLSAIPLLAVSYGVATSQVVNDQTQSADIFANGTLNVEDQTDDTTNLVTATGNALTGSVVSGSLNVQSTQAMSGNATSDSRVTVGTSAGGVLTATSAVTGNTTDAVITGGGLLSGGYNQSTSSTLLYAHSQVTGNAAQTGDLAASTQAIANSTGFGAEDSSIDATVVQSNSSTVNADGGVIWQYVSGQGIASSGAVGNNVTSSTAGTVTQAARVTQTNTSDLVQAYHSAAYGTSQDTVTNATASANNVNLSNTGGSLDTTVNQANSSYVRAQAEETSFAYGGASATAYGVGNSALSGNLGPATFIDNTQVNTGNGVQAIANFSGDTGFDAQASATAMGNAVTGYACSTCQSTIQVRKHPGQLGRRRRRVFGHRGRFGPLQPRHHHRGRQHRQLLRHLPRPVDAVFIANTSRPGRFTRPGLFLVRGVRKLSAIKAPPRRPQTLRPCPWPPRRSPSPPVQPRPSNSERILP